MKKNAFTLTELIAVIVIIGIVVLITIPVIKNMSLKNTEEKYMSYVSLVDSALKTYADTEMSYDTVSYLSITELKNKDLITDFKEATVSISGASYFTVRKESNGKVVITPEVKLQFVNGTNSTVCTKNSCS